MTRARMTEFARQIADEMESETYDYWVHQPFAPSLVGQFDDLPGCRYHVID